MSEPKLTAPQRRYEIMADSDAVYNDLQIAYDEQSPIFLDIVLADVYEGKPPIPGEILERTLGIYVLKMLCDTDTKEVRAFGNTVENNAEKVNVRVPKDRTKRSTLELLDISSVTRNE